jgi:hypothetical protein
MGSSTKMCTARKTISSAGYCIVNAPDTGNPQLSPARIDKTLPKAANYLPAIHFDWKDFQ